MIPLALFLVCCGLVYLGTVQAAFGALMHLARRLAAERSGRDEALGRFLDDPLLFFVPARLLTGALVVLAVGLLALLVGSDTARRLILVGLSSVVLLVACEHLVPLLVVRHDPERVLEVLLPSFAAVAGIVRPLTGLLVRPGAAPRDRMPGPSDDAGEPAGAVLPERDGIGSQEGLIERDERRLIQSIVEFGDTLVREVMTPRPDIVAIRAEATLGEFRTLLREQAYSRIPVFRDSLDNIVGFVFVKDLIPLTGDESRGIITLMRPAHFVPETKRVSDLLREFQRDRLQSAVVVDEYGGTAGLVSLEDLIEEIVGEIRDEYDEESEPVNDEGGGVFVFSGKVSIDAIAERFGVEIAREGFETVGGYLLSRLGRVPSVGETLEVDDLVVHVLEAERRRVNKVRVRKREPVARDGG